MESNTLTYAYTTAHIQSLVIIMTSVVMTDVQVHFLEMDCYNIVWVGEMKISSIHNF